MALRKFPGSAVWVVVLLASATWMLASAAPSSADDDGPKFGPWSTPVNIGPPVNTVLPDDQPFITKDGLSLYFARLEGSAASSPQHIWVAKRNSKRDNWGEPQKLGPAINASINQNHPFVTIDGHWLYFASNRPGGFGRNDIYVSWRPNKHEDFPTDPSGGWQEPVNLGASINTSFGERSPIIFEDDETGVTTLYFDSNRPGLGGFDIYASTLQPDGTFGRAVLVTELSTSSNDEEPTISRNGLEMYFISDRPGSTPDGFGGFSRDIWVSTRARTSDPWGTPQNLDVMNARLGGGPINSKYYEARPALSFDGTFLYFVNGGRPENLGGQRWFDIWMSTRTRLRDRDKDRDKE